MRCFCILLLYFSSTECARILGVFPIPSISHQIVFRAIYNELVNRGHEVVVIVTDPMYSEDKIPPNLKEIDVHDISYDIWAKTWLQLDISEANDFFVQYETILKAVLNLFIEQIKEKNVQKLISDKNKFDVLLIEANSIPYMSFSHIFKAPVILISTLGGVFNNYQVVGAPNHPILFPSLVTRNILNLTTWEKVQNFYRDWRVTNLFKTHLENKQDLVFQEMFGKDIPSSKELYNNVDMLFVNNHPIWSNNRPVPPNVIFMGGIHQKPKKELPKDIESYLNSSKHGVIFISFGTNTNSSMIPPEILKVFTKVLSKLKYNVLWKWDFDVLPGQTDNIRISKWLPQADILRHPNVKLFITQGGLQSTDEAITGGVPLIGIPLLGDQWYNVAKYVELQIGKRLDLFSLTEHELESAIKTVIEDKSYRQNMENLRSVILDQPQQPLERAIWWIEHVIRHGGAKYLRSPSANMSVAEYYEFNIIITVLVIALTTVMIFAFALYKICICLLKPKEVKLKRI